MYSPLIVDKALRSLKKSGAIFKPVPVWKAQEITARLVALVDPANSQLKRPLTPDELAFIKSETILCRYDFRYWAERYGNLERDASMGGGVGPITFWQSQLRALDLIAHREEEIAREFDKHGFSDGISAVWHKARQLGATAIMRLINAHRMTLYKHTRALAASLDEEKIDLIYLKDKVILDNLPFFLKPKIEFEVKDEQIVLEILKSRLTYQKANQRAGVGTSGQFDINHCTEIALWDNPWRLKFDLLPAIPKSPNTFTGWESTANGRGPGNFWYEFTESIRRKDRGFERWLYIFTPSYIEPKKYRLPAPDLWTPNATAQEYADLVERTSPEFTGGRTVRLSRDQLYWWETEYEQADADDTLPMFLTNYCATPEQSFQHHAASAFPVKTIEWMRSTASVPGMPYTPESTARVM